MVRIRSRTVKAVVDTAPPPVKDSRRKRKLLGDGSGTLNGTPPVSKATTGESLRSSKRTRTTLLPYQAPDSVNLLTKLTEKRKSAQSNIVETPKRKVKAVVKKPTKQPAKTLKRLRKDTSPKPVLGIRPSVRRRILKTPDPIIKKSKKSVTKAVAKVKAAKKEKVKSSQKKGKLSQASPKKASQTLLSVQTIKAPKKRKAQQTTIVPDPVPPAKSEGKRKKKEIKPKKGRLNPKPELTNYEKDPTFESKLEVPFISTLAHSRLLIRAVILNDMKLLKKLVQDEPQKIYTMCMRRSSQSEENVIDCIMKNENKEAFQLLRKVTATTIQKFGTCPALMISRENTGHGSVMMFGHAMRQVSVGRGGKEGNDAFLYDFGNYHLQAQPEFHGATMIRKALEIGVSKNFIDFMSDQLSIQNWDFTHLHIALRKGNYEVAGLAISKANQRGGYGFNFLHEEVLTKSKASELTIFKPVSVTKKCTYEPRFTPLHCAAINPNVEIITALLRSLPDYNLADRHGWTVGHYAATCCGPEPLKYLLQFGISPQALTSTKRNGDGYNLLHAAVSAGRAHNVKVIIEYEEKVAKENPPPGEEDNGDDDALGKRKPPSKMLLQNDIKYKLSTGGQNSLHMACHLGHLEIVEILLEAGMDANIPTLAKNDRVTPLMIAAIFGHLDIVKTLVDHGVKVEAKDKRGRTAAHYAAMNGHTHILSYLLRLGVNHLAVDSSGNGLLHYSAAYGWYFATKLCLEVGCPPNATNHWKMTPMAIAFMKGHTGLVTVLIKCDGVDVNAIIDDSSGRTLLLDICSNGFELERLKFLIEDLNANPKCEDFNGNNALHILAAKQPRYPYDQVEEKKQLKLYKACITYLIEKGCIPFKQNLEGISPIMKAALMNNFEFIAKLLDLNIRIPFETDKENNTLLHYLTGWFQKADSIVHSIFQRLCSDPTHSTQLKEMALTYNNSGQTPLLRLLSHLTGVQDEAKEKIRKIVEIFLDKFGVDVDAPIKDEKGRKTALHLTVGTYLLPTSLKYKPSLDVLDGESKTPLVIAVLGGHQEGNSDPQESAEQLIDAGADVNFKFKSEHNISLLLYAAMKASLSFYLIPKLIARGADPREIHPKTRNTVLHYISRKPTLLHSVQALQSALDYGVVPNLQNCDGRTPLHLVVNARGTETDVFYDIEDALISAGADLAIRDSRGRIPLHYAFVKIGNPLDSTFFDPIELVSHLVTAMKSSGATRDIHIADVFGSTPLHYSAFRGATICSSYLIQTLPIQGSIDTCDNNGNTPFGLAVRSKHEGCALNFYQKDADFLRIINNNIKVQEQKTEESMINNSRNSRSSTERDAWKWEFLERKFEEQERLEEESQKYPILEQVVKHDWQGLLYLMIGHLQSSGIGFSTGIATALKTQRFKLAYKLVLKVKKKQELSLESGTLFHTLAKYYKGNEDTLTGNICDQLRKSGLDPRATDEFNSEPVIYALINQQIELCKCLLKNEDVMKKLSLMKPDLFGRTPFTALFWNMENPIICSVNVQEFARDMIAAGVNPNELCEFPIELTQYTGTKFVKKLTNIIPSNGTRYPALILAVICKCYATVKWMLTHVSVGPHQINVNVLDSEGRTPLMHAVRMNDVKMVKLLLDPVRYDAFTDLNGKKEIKVFSSNVNPQITDKKGWTAMDYLMQSPGNNCYHKNVEKIVSLLHQIGGLVNAISGDGTKPLDRAVQYNRRDIVSLISKLTSIPPSKRPLVSDEIPSITTVFPSEDISPIDDFPEAAENLAQRLMEKELQKMKEKGEDDVMKTKPDALCGLDKDNSEVVVVVDKAQDIPFDCLMTKVDLNYGVHGLYNFYKMQLVKQPRGKEMILLFTQWGRVGQQGQFQKTPFVTEEEAIKEFTKIFKAKSGNAWEDIKNFTPFPGKYRVVKKDLRKVKHSTACDVDFSELDKNAREQKSIAPKSTLGLLRRLSMVHKNVSDNYSRRYRYGSFMAEASFDNLPLLPIDVLQKGEEILKEIGDKIKLKEVMDTNVTGKYEEKDKVEVMNDIARLSELFYEMIPVYGYSTEKLEPIFFDHDLRDKHVAISRLVHLELAKSMLLAAQYNQDRIHPWEYVYRCLGTRMQLLDRSRERDREEANIILQYVHNTGENAKVMGIYRIEREGEMERLNNFGVNNRQLLWHGTSAANMLAILKQGLLVAPLGSQISGHLFGKGVYLADCFRKSQNYCRTIEVDGKNRKFILLCEAALGKIYEVNLSEAGDKPMPKGFNSLKSKDSRYEPDPESTVLWEGRTVALGKPKEKQLREEGSRYYHYNGLDYNEYIIFNVDQIAMRYLVEFQE